MRKAALQDVVIHRSLPILVAIVLAGAPACLDDRGDDGGGSAPAPVEAPTSTVGVESKPGTTPPASPSETSTPEFEAPTSIEELAKAELEVVRKLVADFPEDPAAIGLLGNVYSNQGDHSEAAEHWQRALARNPDDPSGYMALGISAMRNGDDEEAVRRFRKTLELDPDFPQAHTNLARVLMERGEFEPAAAVLKRGLEVKAQPALSHCLLGKIAAQAGNGERAKQHYETAIRLHAGCTDAYYGLARLHARSREADKAREYMAKFRELEAADTVRDRDSRSNYDDFELQRTTAAKTFHAVGEFRLRRGGAAAAEACWRAAVAIDPADTASRTALATLCQRTGRDREALEICRELASLEPGNVARHLNVGVISARLRLYDEADAALRRALEIEPRAAFGSRLLAQIQLDQGKASAETVTLAETAARLEPTAAHHFLLGVARARTGDRGGALVALAKAAQLDPSNAGYRRAYQEVLERGKR